MHKFSLSAKIFLFCVIALIGVGAFFVWPKGTKKQVLGAEIKVDPNHPVEIYYGSTKFDNLADMIKEINVEVYPEDNVSTFPPPEMGIGSRITIIRATPVIVTDAKITKTYRTWKATIKDLLAENQIELLGKDSAEPDITALIEYNMKVKITRVAEVEITEKEAIEYKTIKKNDYGLERGQSKVEQKGINGKKEVVYLIKRVDGEEVSRSTISTTVIEESTPEILIIGTGPKMVKSGAYMDLLNAAAKKYDVNATALQCLMLCESNGNTGSVAAAGYVGLFQYDPGFWGPAAAAAGFGGAEWTNAEAQIFTTARLISIGQSRRWPPYAKGCPRTGYTSCASK